MNSTQFYSFTPTCVVVLVLWCKESRIFLQCLLSASFTQVQMGSDMAPPSGGEEPVQRHTALEGTGSPGVGKNQQLAPEVRSGK